MKHNANGVTCGLKMEKFFMINFLEKYNYWKGSRQEFIEIIQEFEKANNDYMLFKKIDGSAIPINLRRLNTFTAEGIFPAKNKAGKYGIEYDETHLQRYLYAIKMRKQVLI